MNGSTNVWTTRYGFPIKVGFLATTAQIGGAETNLLRIIQHAKTGGILPVLCVLPGDGPLAVAVQSLDVATVFTSYHSWHKQYPFRYWYSVWNLARLIRSATADVIHLNHQWLVEFAVQAGRLARRPVVCHIRNLLGEGELAQHSRWLRRADAVIGVSQAVLEPLRSAGIASNRLHLIYNGIDFDVLNGSRPSTYLHQLLDLTPETRLVGVIGRVVPEKGIAEFLMAAARVSREFRNTHFVIVGADDNKGRYVTQLTEQAARLGLEQHVTFMGFRTDVPEILHNLDVVVLPSRSDMPEGLPNTVLEALATGRLVIASRNSGVPEVIVDKQNGFLFDCDDIEGMAAAMMNALWLEQREIDRISERARNTVRNRTIDRQVEALEGLYRQLLSGPHNG